MQSSTEPATKRDAFIASLSPKDRLIHELAVKMLRTRYTPERSNAWAAWMAKQTEKAKAKEAQ